jgi:ABC-type sugar transport system ATPase subunit
MEPVLRLTDIAKSFPGVRALDGVSFDVRAGEVHALLGENGAGKSTLIKIMSGVHEPDAGTVELDGRPVRLASPQAAQAAGVATIYQELLLFPELTVAENVFAGHAPRGRFGGIDWRAARARSREIWPPSTSTTSTSTAPWARSRSATASASRSRRRSRRTPAC